MTDTQMVEKSAPTHHHTIRDTDTRRYLYHMGLHCVVALPQVVQPDITPVSMMPPSLAMNTPHTWAAKVWTLAIDTLLHNGATETHLHTIITDHMPLYICGTCKDTDTVTQIQRQSR